MNQKTALSTILSVFLIIISFCLFGQKDPIRFGKIDKADLEMKAYPADTSAVAAILCDFGYFNSAKAQFERTLRIKVFKKEGTYWGNQVFPFPSDAFIKGSTYNLENGEIIESKLKSESVFKENVTRNIYRKRVAMPNVKEGSIIDLQFSFVGLPSEWRFQEYVPVRWSELIIEQSPYLTFRKNFFGFEPLSVSTDTRWVAKDVPAFKNEPFMNSAENYITKFEIEILNISIPGFYKELCTTWEAVFTTLNESTRFGKALQGCAFLNSTAKDIEKEHKAPMERLIAAHEVIKKTVKWNEKESVISTTENLSNAFNKKIGNSADINLILVGLLKKLDFEVYPVVLSTRSNGLLSPVTPSLEKLNYVVAYVILNDKKYFLDATDQFLPVGMLPERCVNMNGRIIDKNKSDWIQLTPDQDKKFVNFELKLMDENILEGKISKGSLGYAAFDFRKKYEKFNSKEEYIRNFESEHKGLNIINCDLENLDSLYLPLKESYDIKIKNVLTTVGNMVYINPMLYEQIGSNPFKPEERKYPVDFICPSELTYIFKVELPQNAEVVELPKEFGIKLEDGSTYFQYQALSVDKIVTLTYRFIRKKSIYTEAEYGQLRTFFSELVKKHSEQIVIKRL